MSRAYTPTADEQRATAAFWERARAEQERRLREEPAPPEPLPWAYAYRCSACGEQLTRSQYDPGPRACPAHPDAPAETSTHREENALHDITGHSNVSLTYRAEVHKPTRKDYAIAAARIERWAGVPSDLRAGVGA